METKVIALHLHHHNMAHLQELVNALPKVGVGQSTNFARAHPSRRSLTPKTQYSALEKTCNGSSKGVKSIARMRAAS
jgi:hypothetical protein